MCRKAATYRVLLPSPARRRHTSSNAVEPLTALEGRLVSPLTSADELRARRLLMREIAQFVFSLDLTRP